MSAVVHVFSANSVPGLPPLPLFSAVACRDSRSRRTFFLPDGAVLKKTNLGDAHLHHFLEARAHGCFVPIHRDHFDAQGRFRELFMRFDRSPPDTYYYAKLTYRVQPHLLFRSADYYLATNVYSRFCRVLLLVDDFLRMHNYADVGARVGDHDWAEDANMAVGLFHSFGRVTQGTPEKVVFL